MHGSIVVIRNPTGYEAIPLWSKKGDLIPVQWLGFVNEREVNKLGAGGWGKMPAVAVSCAMTPICGWREVNTDQYVLCYRVPHPGCESGWGAYVVTDMLAWPVVITPPYTVPSTMQKAG